MKIEVIAIEANNIMQLMENDSIYGITYGGLFDKFYMKPAKELSLEEIFSGEVTFIRISK